MRALLALVLLGGCLGGGGSGGASRPGVMPMLSELPDDAAKRNAILDQSAQEAGPEQRKGQTKKERKAETFAATAAAILGSAFSTTQNVTLGGATAIGDGTPQMPKSRKAASESTNDEQQDPAVKENVTVPWIKLAPPPQP